LEVDAERDIEGTLIRKCDHIHTKKTHPSKRPSS
jgi:hypothetical protein